MIDEAVDPREISGSRLADLYREHAPAARRLAYLLTGDRWLADDVVQDAFVRLAGRFLDFRDRESAGGYIRRTVVSIVVSRHRRRKVEQAHAAREQARAVVAHVDTDPAERDAVFRNLAKLSERQRAAIVLRYYMDLTDQDIADALRCRPGTVKSLLSRGLDALREVIEDER